MSGVATHVLAERTCRTTDGASITDLPTPFTCPQALSYQTENVSRAAVPKSSQVYAPGQAKA